LISEAILLGDHALTRELKKILGRHEKDIFEEYFDSALLPLREAISKAEGDALRDPKDIQILYEADLALLSRRRVQFRLLMVSVKRKRLRMTLLLRSMTPSPP
jgi:hypothetical protein